MLSAARFLAVSAGLVLTVVLGLAGCSQAPGDAAPPATVTTTGAVVIAQIVTHDTKVALLGGSGTGSDPRALRVAIHKLDGTLVADGITLADLQSRDPVLYDVVTSSFADGRNYVDATLDVDHLN